MYKALFFLLIIFSNFYLNGQSKLMNVKKKNGEIIQIPVKYIDSITYSSVKLDALPTIILHPLNDLRKLTSKDITINAEVKLNEITPIISRGILWDTVPVTINTKNKINKGQGTGYFINKINLNSTTTYYFKAFAENKFGISLSNELVYSTPEIGTVPTIDIFNTELINEVGATYSHINIINTGNSNIIKQGICFSRKTNPTILDSTIIDTTSNSLIQIITSKLELGKTYYFRAFAENKAGIMYSNIIKLRIATNPILKLVKVRLNNPRSISVLV